MTTDEQRHPLRNTLILIAGLLFAWQIVYWIVGDVAMRSPWQTFRYTIELAQTELFWVHLENTMRAFALALVAAWDANQSSLRRPRDAAAEPGAA